ncbi:MAG: hypothetical protein QM601_12445 [Pseudoxanthomonas sp.]
MEAGIEGSGDDGPMRRLSLSPRLALRSVVTCTFPRVICSRDESRRHRVLRLRLRRRRRRGRTRRGFIDLIFAPESPRRLSLRQAKKLRALVPAGIGAVAPCSDDGAGEARRIVRGVQPDPLQFHGEGSDALRGMPLARPAGAGCSADRADCVGYGRMRFRNRKSAPFGRSLRRWRRVPAAAVR